MRSRSSNINRRTHSNHFALIHPPKQTPFAQMPDAQRCPQAPQLRKSLLRFVSQPFKDWPSQFAKPELQFAITHAPPEHAAVPFAATQIVPQTPQLSGSDCVLTHTPPHIV
jgi:hypothetical protein